MADRYFTEAYTAALEQKPGNASRDTRRRVSDAVLQAFHFACDQGDIETAWDLLKLLEFMATRTPPRQTARDRRVKESLLGAYSRLWLILHPEAV
jgi:hypothetical protein